jgi:hypothetical protein
MRAQTVKRRVVVAAATTGFGFAVRHAMQRTDGDFFEWPERLDGPYPIHDGRWCLPAIYHSNAAFLTVFPASLEKVRDSLPSPERFPVELLDRRGAIAIAVLRYTNVFVLDENRELRRLAPYGEIAVAPLCTFRRPAPRLVPLLGLQRPAHWELGMFVTHLPVTTREASQAGREIWNLPKFVADMDFEEGGRHRAVHLAEDDRHIFTLTIERGGQALIDRTPAVFYTAKDGQLLRTLVPVLAAGQRRLSARGRLGLGDHPVADDLRGLEVDTQPIMSVDYLSHNTRLPAPEVVAAARTYDGWRGTDRQRGRFTVSFYGGDPIDLHHQPSLTHELASA